MADEPQELSQRGAGLDDETVQAAAKLSEALEYVERARGHLYAFHQLMGRADLLVGEAGTAFADAGHLEVATRLRTDLVGRNVLQGRWTFQIVEEFDDDYWTQIRDHDRRVREELLNGQRHVHEARMKQRRRTTLRPGHEPNP